MDSQSPLGRVHWKAPTIIVVAFLAALGFAVGHHEFYRHLNNQVVDTGDRLFNQQVNLAIGNAFALLFRAALVIALGTVYWQIFWTTLLRQRKSLAVSNIDAMAGALASVFDLLHLRAILRRKTLLALALLSWLLPLAAVLPPATLSVEVTKHLDDAQQEVPTLDFANPSLIYTTSEVIRDADGELDFGGSGPVKEINVKAGASSELYDLLHSVATNREIPGFPGIGTNKSYELEFAGSSLQCADIQGEDLEFFRSRFMCKGTPSSCNVAPMKPMKIYSAWIPRYNTPTWKPDGPEESHELEDDLLPAQNASRDYSTLWVQDEGSDTQLSEPSSGYGSPYLLIATRTVQPTPYDNGTTLSDWGVLNCSLHYADYTATILSSKDHSAISGFNVAAHDDIIRPATIDLQASRSFSSPEPSDFGHLALLSCLNFILSGDVNAYYISSGIEPQADSRPLFGSSGILGTTLVYASELLLANEVHLGFGGLS